MWRYMCDWLVPDSVAYGRGRLICWPHPLRKLHLYHHFPGMAHTEYSIGNDID